MKAYSIMKRKQEKYSRKNGYSFVEIMIVVMIIGVLSAITITSITKVRANARVKQAETELEMIAAAVRQLAWDTGKWPSKRDRIYKDKETWDLTLPEAGLLATDGSFNNWNGPYLAEIPDDPWGTPYFFDSDYYTNVKVHCVAVGSLGPDKIGKFSYNEDNIFVVLEGGK